MRLAFYQPEIPQNTGTLMRLCACMSLSLDIIHPCGFLWDDRHLRRASMDYADKAILCHHDSWEDFCKWVTNTSHRLVLLDTKASLSYLDFSFKEDDILVVGQESCGVPDSVFQSIAHLIHIPVGSDCRSLNVSLAAAIVIGEALRQSGLSRKGKQG